MGGTFTITIPLVYIYVPLILITSYYLLRFITIKITKLYLENKFITRVRPVIIDVIHESIMYMENKQKLDSRLEFNEKEFVSEAIDKKMKEILPKRVKFGGRFDDTEWSSDIDGCYLEDMKIGARLVFPFHRTVTMHYIPESIWIEKEEIKKKHRESSINNILD